MTKIFEKPKSLAEALMQFDILSDSIAQIRDQLTEHEEALRESRVDATREEQQWEKDARFALLCKEKEIRWVNSYIKGFNKENERLDKQLEVNGKSENRKKKNIEMNRVLREQAEKKREETKRKNVEMLKRRVQNYVNIENPTALELLFGMYQIFRKYYDSNGWSPLNSEEKDFICAVSNLRGLYIHDPDTAIREFEPAKLLKDSQKLVDSLVADSYKTKKIFKRFSTCVCGSSDPHFVPPSMGEPGFYACEVNDSE